MATATTAGANDAIATVQFDDEFSKIKDVEPAGVIAAFESAIPEAS